jgi:hypothetical protein
MQASHTGPGDGISNGRGGSIVLAAALAFFAMTLWAALQLWRMKQLTGRLRSRLRERFEITPCVPSPVAQ